ncbi:MAG TPA: hypothetical protein DEB52_17040 [Hyphomonas sp.]|jgi:hypothetical protein|nr:hypothetical protein [Hyphomonas sp.]|tara:strand:- start:1053 stop:1589 length:537 start_codon:yes stop_codon:yes gene_type:complete
MKTYKITKSDIDETGLFIGDINTDKQIDGHLVIEAGLGSVRFYNSLRVRGAIRVDAGSGIAASGDIIAGFGIKAGWSIIAGGDITAGWGIAAGRDITAGGGIIAGWGITAGSGITAGRGIKAGLSIAASTVSAGMRIFAGTTADRLPAPEDMQIRALVESGEVCFGEVVAPAPEGGRR